MTSHAKRYAAVNVGDRVVFRRPGKKPEYATVFAKADNPDQNITFLLDSGWHKTISKFFPGWTFTPVDKDDE